MLVVHTNKKVENKRPDISDLQGGASIGRLAGGIIIMHNHEPKESHIYQIQNYTKPVEHNRTIIIAKSRNGQGKMDRLSATTAQPLKNSALSLRKIKLTQFPLHNNSTSKNFVTNKKHSQILLYCKGNINDT